MNTLIISCPRRGLFYLNVDTRTGDLKHPSSCDVHTGLARVPTGFLWVYGGRDLVLMTKDGTLQERCSLGAEDVHDVAACEDRVYVANTQHNSVDVYDIGLKRKQARIDLFADSSYDYDICHLNSVAAKEDGVYVTMFKHPGGITEAVPPFELWRKGLNAGVVCKVEDERFVPVVNNLWHPHSLTFHKDRAVVCDSMHKRILIFDTDQMPWVLLRELEVPENYVRGVACTDQGFYVGLSVVRRSAEYPFANAKVAYVDWESGFEYGLEVPVTEIFAMEVL